MEEEIWNHIIKRLTDTETAQSREALDQWLKENPENNHTYQEVTLLWRMSANPEPHDNMEWIGPGAYAVEEKPSKTTSAFWRYSIAAACIAVLGICAVKLFHYKQEPVTQEWVTQVAQPGESLSVRLPDSSTVALNAGSSIRYAKALGGNGNRLIQLSGEAFFDVVHDAGRPFIVESSGIKTIVYGTSFNVRAYPNEADIKVAVKSGKVGVLENGPYNIAKPIFLLPNRSVSFHKDAKKFSRVETLNGGADDWTKGELVFDQTPISEVMATLSRRFALKLDTSALRHTSCKLTARFRNQDLHTILKTIQTVMNIKISQIDQTIYLKGGTVCKEN